METVKLRITIEIETSEVVDTGLTVDEWNFLDDDGRSERIRQLWDEVAEADNGGVSVLTPGALL